MSELVNLTSFRKDNKLTQFDIANYLQTSRGFISMVESGKNQLSEDKLKQLLNSEEEMGWRTENLVPHLSRIKHLFEYLNTQSNGNSFFETTGNSDSSFCLSNTEYENIAFGRSPITDTLADKITYRYPQINREWLLIGTGPMLTQSSNQPNNLQIILNRLDMINHKLDIILDAISKEVTK